MGANDNSDNRTRIQTEDSDKSLKGTPEPGLAPEIRQEIGRDAFGPRETQAQNQDSGVEHGVADFEELKSGKADAAEFRKEARKHGIDTSSPAVPIDLYEPYYESAPDHSAKVKETISSPEYGLSPGAKVNELAPKESSRDLKLADFKDSPDPLAAYASEHSTRSLKDLSSFIERQYLAPGTEKGQRVLNVSHEHSQLTTAASIAGQMRRDPEASRALIEKVLGKEAAADWISSAKLTHQDKAVAQMKGAGELELQMETALIPYVKDAVAASPGFKEAMAACQDTTRRAAESGVAIVVSTGNQGDRADGSVYNYYAQSDHVIAVAGHDSKLSPLDYSDDSIWEKSSPGNERFRPSVTAQSFNLPSDVSGDGGKSGTSMAAPLVSATLAVMGDLCPQLSFQEKKEILERTAKPIEGVHPEKQGAGRVDPVQAMLWSQAIRFNRESRRKAAAE